MGDEGSSDGGGSSNVVGDLEASAKEDSVLQEFLFLLFLMRSSMEYL